MQNLTEDEQLALAIRASLGEDIQIPDEPMPAVVAPAPPNSASGQDDVAPGDDVAAGYSMAAHTSAGSSPSEKGNEVGPPVTPIFSPLQRKSSRDVVSMTNHDRFRHDLQTPQGMAPPDVPFEGVPVGAHAGGEPLEDDEDAQLAEAIRLSLLPSGDPAGGTSSGGGAPGGVAGTTRYGGSGLYHKSTPAGPMEGGSTSSQPLKRPREGSGENGESFPTSFGREWY